MSTKGICHLSQIPLRGEPRSSAEMVSQLLYGETYSVLSLEDDWYFIEMDYDGYRGYISHSSFFALELDHSSASIQPQLFASLVSEFTPYTAVTSLGSETHQVGQTKKFFVDKLAKLFLGVPYLWGGRHFSGIDCSGFVQVVYKVIGVKLPRDASQQQRVGTPIAFENLYEGDLVYFEKNEKVMHVGLYLEGNRIIHSHGYVRIDILKKDGIYNSDTGIKSHSYHSAKRLG